MVFKAMRLDDYSYKSKSPSIRHRGTLTLRGWGVMEQRHTARVKKENQVSVVVLKPRKERDSRPKSHGQIRTEN